MSIPKDISWLYAFLNRTGISYGHLVTGTIQSQTILKDVWSFLVNCGWRSWNWQYLGSVLCKSPSPRVRVRSPGWYTIISFFLHDGFFFGRNQQKMKSLVITLFLSCLVFSSLIFCVFCFVLCRSLRPSSYLTRSVSGITRDPGSIRGSMLM